MGGTLINGRLPLINGSYWHIGGTRSNQIGLNLTKFDLLQIELCSWNIRNLANSCDFTTWKT
jgi:hypothetical protein